MGTAAIHRSSMHKGGFLLLHMGDTGFIRPWRILQRAQIERPMHPKESIRLLWRTLRAQGMLQVVQQEGQPLRWHWRSGHARNLLELTQEGRQWFRLQTHREPVMSELDWVMHQHSSPRHALAILETRDYLRQLGLPTVDDPPPCPQSAADPLGPRSEPDLLSFYQERIFPVEVQREVGSRLLLKWEKSLELYQRLMLITFSEARLRRQGAALMLARQRGQLPTGRILLASLERFEHGLLAFTSL